MNGYYFRGGFFIPWIGDRYSYGKGTTREVFLITGYLLEKTSAHIDPVRFEPNKKIKSITYEVGLENVEWMTPQFGFDIRLSLGVQHIVNNEALWDNSNLSPILDIAIGLAF